MSIFKRLVMVMAVASLLTVAIGCEKEGPAEKAGKQLDEAMEGAKDKLDEATN